jgi:DNA-binding MarR family transcriptional regulator
VERRPDEGDRRRVSHALTPAGADLLHRADRAVDAHLVALLDHLPEGRARRATDGLALWDEAITRAGTAALATP